MAFGRNKNKDQDRPGFLDRAISRLGAQFADDDFDESSAPRARAARNDRTSFDSRYVVGERVTVSWNRFSPEQLATIGVYAKKTGDDLLYSVVAENAKVDVVLTGENIEGFRVCLTEAVLYNQDVYALKTFEEAARAGKVNPKNSERIVVFMDENGNPTIEEAPAVLAEEFIDKMQFIREQRPDEFPQLDDRTSLPTRPKMSQKYSKEGPGKKDGGDSAKDGEMSVAGKKLLNFGEFWQLVLDTAKTEDFNRTDAEKIAIKMMKLFNQVGGYDLWLTTKPKLDALEKRATDAEAKVTELEAERDKLKERTEHQSKKIDDLTEALKKAEAGGGSSGEPDPKPAEPPKPGPKPANLVVAKVFIEMLERQHGVKPENLPERLRNAGPDDKIPFEEALQLQKDAIEAQKKADEADHVVDSVDELAELMAKYGF